jgi:Ca2+-binding RTX toxin-like protein
MERYLTKKNDTIVVNKSNETITIETLKKGGIDSIKINDANVKFEDLTFNQKETSLNITVKYSDDTTQDIIVKDYFTDTNHTNTTSTVKNIILNGEKYSILDLGVITSGQTSFTPNKKGIVTGTTFNDTIDLNTSEINLVVKAGKGNDTITTGRGDDKIYAQYGNNTITAGTGNDKIYSGKGNDTFIFNKGDGEDTIYSSHMGDTLKFDSAPDLKNGYSKVNNDLVISYGSSDKVTVSNYFKQKEGNAMEIESNAIINVTGRKNIVGSYLNDNITGSETNDKIYTGNGNDTITADKGNDTIYLGTGEKTINIKSGDGDDTIIFQSKDISNTSVKLVFDTTDTTDITYGQSTNGKDLYIIRGTEKTIIKNYFTYKTTPNIKIGDNALNITSYEIVGDLKKANKITDTALNDTITGGNKNDTITLSNGGEDSISLLNGNDTVIVENGYSGTAEITSDSGNDTLKFENMLVNVSKSNFNTTNDGTDLVIGNITYKNIRKNTVGRTLKIVDAQKTTTIINNIKEGKISGTNGNDIIFASEGNNTITTTKGDDIIFLNK